MIRKDLLLPAYDFCLKCSHIFNLLDSRGAISVTERVKMISRIRSLVIQIAKHYALPDEQESASSDRAGNITKLGKEA
jgi:glycyl-tRNA synthetase alpha chain